MPYYLTLEVQSGDVDKKNSMKHRVNASKEELEQIEKERARIYEKSGHTNGGRNRTWIYLEAITNRNWKHESTVGNVMIFKRG